MSKSFSQAPKPPQLTAGVISAFERSGASQDNRARISPNVENPELTNVEMGKTANPGLGVTTKLGKAEPTRRLSIDLPGSWHRRFKTACTKADKKMVDEVTEFIKRRTIELEQE